MIKDLFVRRLLLAVLFTLAVLSGCDRASKDFQDDSPPTLGRSQIISEGNESLQQMKDAASQRDYDKYFDSYVVLRKRYVELANDLGSNKSATEATESLDTLLEWEQMIKAARAVWKEMGEEGDESSEDLPQRIQNMLKEGRESWKRQNTEWAPIESQLDNAMKKTQEVREHKATNKNGT